MKADQKSIEVKFAVSGHQREIYQRGNQSTQIDQQNQSNYLPLEISDRNIVVRQSAIECILKHTFSLDAGPPRRS